MHFSPCFYLLYCPVAIVVLTGCFLSYPLEAHRTVLSGPGWSSPRVLLNQFPSVCVCFLFSSFGVFSFFPFLDHFLSCRAAAVASCVHLFFSFFGVYTPSLVFLYVKWSGGSLFRCLLVDSCELYGKGLGGNLSRVVFRSLGLAIFGRGFPCIVC